MRRHDLENSLHVTARSLPTRDPSQSTRHVTSEITKDVTSQRHLWHHTGRQTGETALLWFKISSISTVNVALESWSYRKTIFIETKAICRHTTFEARFPKTPYSTVTVRRKFGFICSMTTCFPPPLGGSVEVCTILLRLYTSTEHLKRVYTSPGPFMEIFYFTSVMVLIIIYNFYVNSFYLKVT
jgi:hypothetical protein